MDKEQKFDADLKFRENMKRQEQLANIESVKLRIKDEIDELISRLNSLDVQYSKLSSNAVKEKKQIEKYRAQFNAQIKELEKQYEKYENMLRQMDSDESR